MFKLTASSDSFRFYTHAGREYLAHMWAQNPGQVFVVQKKSLKNGKWQKCSAQEAHYLKRQVAAELKAA